MTQTSDRPSTAAWAAASTPAKPSSPVLPLMLILFIGSGCSALIYEIVWLQLLQLIVGSTAISLGVLLGTFMGGMCLGSLLLPKFISSRKHPLRVYAILELCIGILALIIVLGMPWIEDLYTHIAAPGMGGLAVRSLVSVLCLLPPTVLMGATLPAISRYVQTTKEGVSWLGLFYGGNIVGAVIGCLLAGFYLLPNFDMLTATYVAFAINIAVCAIGLAVAAVASYEPPVPTSPLLIQRAPAAWSVYFTIALSGLSGLGAEVVWTRQLSLMLGQTVYTFSIILAVFLFGLGIGSTVGSMLARTVRPRIGLGMCQLLLAAAIAWAAYAITNSLPYWPINPEISTSPWFTFQFDLASCMWAVLPGAVLWGASFPLALAAVAAPGQDPGKLVGGVYAANTVGGIIGSIAFSTFIIPGLGTHRAESFLIIVAAAAALVTFMPLLWPEEQTGQPAQTPAGGFGYLIGVLIALSLAWTVQPMPWGAVAFGRNAATWIPTLYPGILKAEEIRAIQDANARSIKLKLVGDRVVLDTTATWTVQAESLKAQQGSAQKWIDENQTILVSAMQKSIRPIGFEHNSEAIGDVDIGRPHSPDRFCLYVGEGINVSAAVTLDNAGWKYFHGAGKVQASSTPDDMHLQRMLGHISALTFKDHAPKKVLVVACGAGVTAGSFVPYNSVENIVIVDIEPMVPQFVTPQFGDQNYHVVDGIREANPHVMKDGKLKVNVIYDDGRHYVRTTDEKFDVITSDPIDPWVKGCAALNTKEYYEMCKKHLNPGGIVALWIPLYESDLATTKSILATFFEAFPNGILWSNESGGKGYDAVLFGQVDGTHVNVDEMQAWLDKPENEAVRKSLEDVNFGHRRIGASPDEVGVAVDLLSTFAGRAEDLKQWGHDAQINRDSNLRLQYLAGKANNYQMSADILDDILANYQFPTGVFEGKPETMNQLHAVLEAGGRRPRAHITMGPAKGE